MNIHEVLALVCWHSLQFSSSSFRERTYFWFCSDFRVFKFKNLIRSWLHWLVSLLANKSTTSFVNLQILLLPRTRNWCQGSLVKQEVLNFWPKFRSSHQSMPVWVNCVKDSIFRGLQNYGSHLTSSIEGGSVWISEFCSTLKDAASVFSVRIWSTGRLLVTPN